MKRLLAKTVFQENFDFRQILDQYWSLLTGIHQTKTIQLIRRLITTYLFEYRFYFLQILVLMLLHAAMTGALVKLMEPAINIVFSSQTQWGIVLLLLFLMGTFSLRGMFNYFSKKMLNTLSERLVVTMREQLCQRLLHTDHAFLKSMTSGDILTRIMHDTEGIQRFFSEVTLNWGKNLFTLIILIGLMFYQDVYLSLSIFIIFPIVIFVVLKISFKIKSMSHACQRAVSYLNGHVNQTLHNIDQIKAYNMETYESEKARTLIQSLSMNLRRRFTLQLTMEPFSEILMGLGICCILIYGMNGVSAGFHTAGSIFSYILAFSLTYDPLKRFNQCNIAIQQGLASGERFFYWLDTESAIKAQTRGDRIASQDYSLSFNQVSFDYGERKVLDSLSFEIPQGSMVGFVGVSGGGKTTLFNLLLRFYDVTDGSIALGGVDIREFKVETLRSYFSLVSQESALFDDTVWNNIAYGKLDAAPEEIEAASEAALVKPFASDLADGYQTMIGEKGYRLSGGQKQRLLIARAFLHQSPILLLDEATSALDVKSEKSIQTALHRLRKGYTTVIVAHRLSMVSQADWIYVMDKGRIVERGSHAELLKRKGLYAHLYRLQNQEEKVLRLLEEDTYHETIT